MNTTIPLTGLLESLENRLLAGTIAASLNAAALKGSVLQKKLHGNTKRVYPFWKVCQNCKLRFSTHTKEQAVRNKTCGPACAAIMIGKGRLGQRKPLEERKGAMVPCTMCSILVWRFACQIKRPAEVMCSSSCNAIKRGAEWGLHGYKGRINRTPESYERARAKMTGPNNPAWKGGLTYRNRKGAYSDQPIKYVRCPPLLLLMARKDGYVMHHRLVVALAVGRPLLRTEAVHHRNHLATDNSPWNLMLFETNGQHKAYEHGADIKPLWCGSCLFTTLAKSGACACPPALSLRCEAA